MEKNEELKIVLGVSILFLIIMNGFSFLNRIVTYFFIENSNNVKLILFFESNILWIVFLIVIITTLLVFYNKKIKMKIYPEIFRNSVITSTVGLMLSLDGLFNISNTLPKIISNATSILKTSSMVENFPNNVVKKVLILSVFNLLMILCQIFIGVYLIIMNNKKTISNSK